MDKLYIDNGNWWRYYQQYKAITDKLIKEDAILVKSIISLPFLFSLRHTMELGFKASILDFGLKFDKNHKLDYLFNAYKKELLVKMDNIGVVQPAKEKILFIINELNSLIDILVFIDSSSQNFRYPTDTKDKIFHEKEFSLEQIINLYNKTNRLISFSSIVFTDRYFDYENIKENCG